MKQRPAKAKLSLDAEFRARWASLGGPELKPEHRFHPRRRWAFDYAHPESMVAIELEGGIWIPPKVIYRKGKKPIIRGGGRHNSPQGFIKDCEKYNTAATMGWTIFRLTRECLENNGLLPDIIRMIQERTKK